MILVNPAEAYLPSYVAALERGWSPDNLRPEATHEHLARIAGNAAAFLEAQVDLEAAGDPIALPDGTTVPRLPGMVRWMWDGEFCGTVGFRWQPGTEALPPMCLGHIGYCVVPWKRRRGYATRAVQETLPFARQQGLRYVEITTTRDNRPSQGVVEKCGGTFVEEFVAPAALGGRTHRRYRIALSATAAAEAGSDDSVAGKPSRASICVFCGSSPGARPEYRHAAEALGRAIATQGRTLVYGGGNVGLMCAVADAVLHGGGRVTGVIPQHLVAREVAHGSLTELKIVESMHERKQLMATLADAFVLLPGGLGSLEEFFEVWTWGQLGLHAKPYGLLNVSGYFDPLLAFVDHAVQERFVRSEHRGLLLVDENPERLLSRLDAHAPPTHPKWIDRERR